MGAASTRLCTWLWGEHAHAHFIPFTAKGRFSSQGEILVRHLRRLRWIELGFAFLVWRFSYIQWAVWAYVITFWFVMVISICKWHCLDHVGTVLEAGAEVLKFPGATWQVERGDCLQNTNVRQLEGTPSCQFQCKLCCCELKCTQDWQCTFPCVGGLQWLKKYSTIVRTLPGCADLLLSVNATMTCWRAWQDDADAQETWDEAWTPVIGSRVACNTNLPIVITFLLVVNVLVHIAGCSHYSSIAEMRRQEFNLADRTERYQADEFKAIKNFLVAVTAAADSANLLLVSNVTFAASNSLANTGGTGKDRTPRFFMKVFLGSAPGIWFKVSVLQHLYSRLDFAGIFANVIAILTTFLCSFGPIYEQWDFLWSMKCRHVGRPDNPSCTKMFCNSIILAVSVYTIFVSVVRFWGIWHCPNHIFQFWQMECLEQGGIVTPYSEIDCPDRIF